jgi:hypothetical protein
MNHQTMNHHINQMNQISYHHGDTMRVCDKLAAKLDLILIFDVLTPLSATFQLISWQPVLVVEEVGVPGENHRPWASNW